MPKAATASKPARKAPAKTADETLFDEDNWFVGVDDVVDFLNVVYYGREGSAKTTGSAFMANIDRPGKVLIINAEGGVKKRPLQKRGVDTSRLVLWPDPKRHQRVTHKSLDSIYRKVKSDLEADPDSWAGVVFDSATEIHQAILDSVQERRVQILLNKGQDVDENHVDLADYGTMSKMFRDVLRKFRDLPCHFIVTALERRDIDKDTGKPQYGPAITPGLQADLLGFVDIVVMCKAEDEDGPFRGLTRANSRYRAKDRFDVLPRVMCEPTFDRLEKYVSGVLDEEDDVEQSRIGSSAKTAQDKSKDADETEDDEADDADDDD